MHYKKVERTSNNSFIFFNPRFLVLDFHKCLTTFKHTNCCYYVANLNNEYQNLVISYFKTSLYLKFSSKIEIIYWCFTFKNSSVKFVKTKHINLGEGHTQLQISWGSLWVSYWPTKRWQSILELGLMRGQLLFNEKTCRYS